MKRKVIVLHCSVVVRSQLRTGCDGHCPIFEQRLVVF
jgi:hypothetical protein